MKLARIRTPEGPRFVARSEAGWVGVDGLFGVPILSDETFTPAVDDFLSPVEPGLVIGIAHHDAGTHALPVQAWMKSPRSVIGPETAVTLVPGIGEVVVEGELAAVIGSTATALTTENALDHVLGFTIANDVTNVDRALVDEKNFESKAGSGHTPLGPWIETEVGDPENLEIVVSVNGVVREKSGTASLPSTVVDTLVYVTRWLTLEPGDVVMTGSPRTAAPIVAGDAVEITIEGVGSLRNTVE